MILQYPLIHSNERFDLEELQALQSNVRTDSKYWQAGFNSSTSHIVQGFSISSAAIGQSSLSVVLDGSVLVNPDNTTDFSWFSGAVGASAISVPVSVGNLIAGRNYLELELSYTNGTPLQRVFWDPSANGGEGAEFSQSVNTTTELSVSVIVNQSGFNSGDSDRLPLAIVDVDSGTNLIAGILDERNLFFRLGTGSQPTHTFPWGTQAESATTLTFDSASGIAYTVGETVTFTSGATATVVTGGTQNITVYAFSSYVFALGDTVTGGTSGGSATLLSYYESFSGADKDITDLKSSLDAIMTEIARIKGTTYWYQVGAEVSLPLLQNYVNALITPVSSIGKSQFYWSGSALSITDAATTAQASTDNIAAIRIPGQSTTLNLRRADGTGSTSAISIASGSLLYVQLPNPTANTNYSGTGTGATNYQVVTRAAFSPSSTAFVICYNEGGFLVFPSGTNLASGEYLYLESIRGNDKILATSSNYTITNNDEYGIIEATAGSGGITITLPAAATANKGREIAIKKMDSAIGAITISGTVDGVSNPQINVQNGEVTIFSDGSSFYFKNKWPILTPISQVSVSSDVTLTNNAIHLVSTAAVRSLVLPAPNVNTCIMVKDISGLASTNPITIVRFGSEKIETVAASYVLSSSLGCWTFVSDGTDWFLIETGANWVPALVNPMTTLGDMIYGGSAGVATRLAGDTSNTRKFYRELSVASVATAPVWDTLISTDLPEASNGASARGAVTTFSNNPTTSIKVVSSADYTILNNDGYTKITVSTGASNRSIVLPNPVENTGREIWIQKSDVGAGTVNVVRYGSETLGTAAGTQYLTQTGAFLKIVSDGTNWLVIDVWDYRTVTWSTTDTSPTTTQFGNAGSMALSPGQWIASGAVQNTRVASQTSMTCAISTNSNNTTTDHVAGVNVQSADFGGSWNVSSCTVPNYPVYVNNTTTTVYFKVKQDAGIFNNANWPGNLTLIRIG